MPQRTIDEAAQILGVTAAEVWRRIRRGELTGHREGSARETRLLVNLPVAMAMHDSRSEPNALAQELRTDVALLVREMDDYRVEADLLAQEREELRTLLQGVLADVQATRVTLPALPPPPAPDQAPDRAPEAATPDVTTADAPATDTEPDAAPEPEAPVTATPEVDTDTEADTDTDAEVDVDGEGDGDGAPQPAPEIPETAPPPEPLRDEATPPSDIAPVTAPPEQDAPAPATPEPPTRKPTTPEPPLETAQRPPPVSRYVAAGVRLHYLEWVPAQPIAAPPVILIHGISGNARNYDALTAALGDQFHLFALDLRGHGDSAWDEHRDYRISALVYDLNLFIDALGLPEVVLVGTGLGADVALGLVSARPGIVRGLVLNDSGPEAGSSGLTRVLRAIQDAPQDFDNMAAAVAWWREYYPALRDYDDAVVQDFIHSTLRETTGGRLIWKFDPALRDIDDLSALRDVDLSVAVGRIACPLLVIRGEHSDVLSRDAARRLRGRVRAAALVEAKGVAHAPSLVEADVLPELQAFLRSIGQEGPAAAS